MNNPDRDEDWLTNDELARRDVRCGISRVHPDLVRDADIEDAEQAAMWDFIDSGDIGALNRKLPR